MQISINEVKVILDRIRKSKRFRKYIIAGLTAFFVDFSVFRLTYINLEMSVQLSSFLGISSGFLTSFILQKYWTFKGVHTKKSHHQLAIYAFLTAFNTLFTAEVVILAEKTNLKFAPELGKILASAIIVSWNYATFRYFLFKEDITK